MPPLFDLQQFQMQKNTQRRLALTIAGFDPSGGAGVIADLRTFTAFGVDGVAAITSITFQNSGQVFGAAHLSADTVRSQVMPLLESGEIACAKTGMLPTREIVAAVAALFRETELPPPVVDPVIMSSSGQRLMSEDAVVELIEKLLPLTQLITPNIQEAETLSGLKITSESDMRQAAATIRKLGARAVLIKGGHLKQEAEGSRQEAEGSRHKAEGSKDQSDDAIDVLDNDGNVTVFREPRVQGGNLHGSGCILSAAIAAGLGKGMSLEDSVRAAKGFVLDAIKKSVMSDQ